MPTNEQLVRTELTVDQLGKRMTILELQMLDFSQRVAALEAQQDLMQRVRILELTKADKSPMGP